MKSFTIDTLINKLWPLNRSITGEGNFKTLKIIQELLPNLKIKSFKTGKKVYDWKIPKVWVIKDAYIKNKSGKKLLDFNENNLSVINYSHPIYHKSINFINLKKNLFFLENQKEAIPYVTSYYKKNWGFCINYKKYLELKRINKNFEIKIDSYFKNGHLNYGEYLIKGKSNKEIIFTSYICHPSMGNNELSGPLVLTKIFQWIAELKDNYYTYRLILLPETIGSIAYINKNYKKLKKNILMGFCITCMGGDQNFSFIPNRKEGVITNYFLNDFFTYKKLKRKKYSWLDRGSDERQFSSPNIDLPFCTLFKTKFGEYKEYHTSLDNRNFLKKRYLNKSINFIKTMIKKIETNRYPVSKIKCEPFLTKYGLYNPINFKKNLFDKSLLNIISYCDGNRDINLIAKQCKVSLKRTKKIIEILKKNNLISLL